jgi:aminopeptidase-like protein
MDQNIRKFIERLCPLNRSICSPELDKALEIIQKEFIRELVIDEYPTGTPAWTWFLPRKWDLQFGSIHCQGKEMISTKEEPLCVWSGSLPVRATVSYDELIKHLYTDPDRPDLLCWYFRYYGNLDWGFSLPYNLIKTLDRKALYDVEIQSSYYDGYFKLGWAKLEGRSKQIILVSSDICHPYQCNDSLSGAAVAYKLFKYLQKKTNRFFTYLFTFLPETIGTIAFLSQNEKLIPQIVYNIYTEFWGRKGRVRLQKSLKGDSLFDRTAEEVLRKHFDSDFTILKFREDGVMNDEKVTTMTNLWIPSIALNRGPYYEYHSHQDVPGKLEYPEIWEGFEIVRDLMEEMEKSERVDCRNDRGCISLNQLYPDLLKPADDFIPIPLFKGPIFLTRYNLWVDWRKDPELNAALDLIMACMNGCNSVAEIAAFVRLPFEKVLAYVKRFASEGLICIQHQPEKASV